MNTVVSPCCFLMFHVVFGASGKESEFFFANERLVTLYRW